jgi:hypothetical protein
MICRKHKAMFSELEKEKVSKLFAKHNTYTAGRLGWQSDAQPAGQWPCKLAMSQSM